MPNNSLYRDIRKIYSGLAPSTSYPQRFEGCLRNVKINDLRLKLAENMMTKPGCQVVISYPLQYVKSAQNNIGNTRRNQNNIGIKIIPILL